MPPRWGLLVVAAWFSIDIPPRWGCFWVHGNHIFLQVGFMEKIREKICGYSETRLEFYTNCPNFRTLHRILQNLYNIFSDAFFELVCLGVQDC